MLSLRLRKQTTRRNTKGRAAFLGAVPQPHSDSDSSTQLGAAAPSGLVWERLQLAQVLPFYEGVQALGTNRAEAQGKAVTPVHRWPVKHRKSRTWRASRYMATSRGKCVRERKREHNRRRSPRVLRVLLELLSMESISKDCS